MRRITTGIVALSIVLAFAVPATASAVAPSAAAMLQEQVASQEMIGALFDVVPTGSPMNAIYFRTVYKSSTKAVVRVASHLHDGSRIPGVLVLRKYSGKWYFYSMTRGSSSAGISNVAIPAGIDSSAVDASISQQAAHQTMLKGIITGGYEKLTVRDRGSNVGTRRISVKLSRGTRRSAYARVYAYSKTATNSTVYWFVSAIK